MWNPSPQPLMKIQAHVYIFWCNELVIVTVVETGSPHFAFLDFSPLNASVSKPKYIQ